MISESMKAALTAKALRNEALLFANYGKLYFEEKGLKFSGIAGIICVSRRGSSKLIKIVDIQFFKVRFELEVYSRFEEYMQQTGKGLVQFPIPHKEGCSVVALQFASDLILREFEEMVGEFKREEILLQEEGPPEDHEDDYEQEVARQTPKKEEVLKFT
jgi:hypothetical protein